MNNIKNYFIRYSWAIWSGVMFTQITGIGITNWKWWIFNIPLCILVAVALGEDVDE